MSNLRFMTIQMNPLVLTMLNYSLHDKVFLIKMQEKGYTFKAKMQQKGCVFVQRVYCKRKSTVSETTLAHPRTKIRQVPPPRGAESILSIRAFPWVSLINEKDSFFIKRAEKNPLDGWVWKSNAIHVRGNLHGRLRLQLNGSKRR